MELPVHLQRARKRSYIQKLDTSSQQRYTEERTPKEMIEINLIKAVE